MFYLRGLHGLTRITRLLDIDSEILIVRALRDHCLRRWIHTEIPMTKIDRGMRDERNVIRDASLGLCQAERTILGDLRTN